MTSIPILLKRLKTAENRLQAAQTAMSDIQIQLGKCLRKQRRGLGIKFKTVSAKTGIAMPHIHNMETGTRPISMKQGKAIWEAIK